MCKKTLIDRINYLKQHPELMPVVVGTTACGKTRLAVFLSGVLDGGILSADSRQVYRGMDIGSGKDIEEYFYKSKKIPYALIDIADAGSQYNVFLYQKLFDLEYKSFLENGIRPILCGGSGMYLQAVLGNKQFAEVPFNDSLRNSMEYKSLTQLASTLSEYNVLHNQSDTTDRERCLRAIEIADFEHNNPKAVKRIPPASYIIGIRVEANVLRQRIRYRLETRFENGMVEEVKGLLNSGLKPEQLVYYGLEYKFITNYITGNIKSFEEMKDLLFFAICQFAKRQRTWFRSMEKKGWVIDWIDIEELGKLEGVGVFESV